LKWSWTLAKAHKAWKTVKLLFVRGLNEPGEPEVSKKDWALFLTTDVQLSTSKMLEVYALRWGIEVYFKEAKQHLGFLSEQNGQLCLAHRLDSPLCHSLPDAGACEACRPRGSGG